MIRPRLCSSAALGLALAALAAPAAVAQQDLRGPDARDAARAASVQRHQDMRPPDVRDYADGRGTFNAPEVTVVRVPEPAPSTSTGLDWGDAAIGAGFLLAGAMLVIGATLALVRRSATSRTA